VVIEPAAGRKCAAFVEIFRGGRTDPDYPDVTLRDAAALRNSTRQSSGPPRGDGGPPSACRRFRRILGVLIDQAHKFWMLGPFDIAAKGSVRSLPSSTSSSSGTRASATAS
jgi:hypothetical protein